MTTAIQARPTARRQMIPGRASANHSLKALALYASIVGRQAGVEIRFGNYPSAATDGKTIFLPTLADVAEAKWIVILRALIDHEVMHVRQTQFDTIKDCNSPLAKVLSNILEDCWGEREQAKVYPGSLRAIRAGMDELVELKWFCPPPADVSTVDPQAAFVSWLLHDLRGRHFVMPELTGWAHRWRAIAEPMFGTPLLDTVLRKMYEVDTCASSARAVSIANQVVELLREQQQQLQQQAQPQTASEDAEVAEDAEDAEGAEGAEGADGADGADGAEGADGAQGAEGAGQADGQSSSAGSKGSRASGNQGSGGEGEAATQASDDRTGGTAGSNTSAASGNVQADGDPSQGGTGAGSGWIDAPESIEERVRRITEILEASLEQLPATEMADAICAKLIEAQVMSPANDNPAQSRHSQVLNRLGSAALPETADCSPADLHEQQVRTLAKSIERHLGAKLRDMLEARTQCVSSYSRRGLRVGAQRLSRAKSGSLEVFRRSEEGDELSTAISLLVDMSGSMANGFGHTTRNIGAAGAAYAVAETLGRFSLPFSWVNFGSSAQAVKRFNDSWRQRRSSATVSQLGGTVLDIPLLRLLPELAARDEERKLVLVITDGEPDHQDAVVAAMSMAPMTGVEVAMLFIGDDGRALESKLAIQGIQVARAQRAEDLARALFEAVENAFV